MTAMKHPIPDAALDGDIAILGRKGGGKTYTSKGIVERLLDMGRRVLVLDPLGVWAGLRTSADGKGAGYKVAIFGGALADLPLDPAAAEPLARIIATENLPAVIDLSELSKHAQQAFLFKFLHELRRVNKDALTIVLEEADVFAPQNPQGDDSKLLHGEIDWIARRGRFRGFRLVTITQRPARLSKDVLTQCSTLIAHKLPAPQDRDAVKDWVDGNGDRDKAREVFDTLANLAVGEAWVYAPEHDMLGRFHFPPIKTLDTSSTPKAGETRIEPKTLAEVDVSGIVAALAAAAKEDAPAKKTGKGANGADLDAAEQRGYQRGYAEGHEAGAKAQAAQHQNKMKEFAGVFADLAGGSIRLVERPVTTTEPVAPPVVRSAPSKPRAVIAGVDPLLSAALSIWPVRLTWPALAAMCGRKARGGHFNTAKKRLLESGLVREDDGLVVPSSPPALPANEVPADILERNLPQPSAKMFSTIRSVPGITPGQMAERLGLKPTGGHWNTGLSTLRKNNLIDEQGERLTVRPELLSATEKAA